jgi:lysophospholipase L1-like esterase
MSVHAQGLALKADRQMIKNFEETGLYESNIERKNREEKQLKRTKRLRSIKKHHVSLLGDSIIDNKVYVEEGELSVTEHLQHNSSSNFTMIAVDGDTTEDVLENQLDNLKEPVSHIVLSIGGNDLLQNLHLLQDETSGMKFALEKSSELIGEIQENYTKILEHLSQYDAKVLLCTVYEGDLESDVLLAEYDKAGQAMLKMHNDTVYYLASKFDVDVLELRNIFTNKEDYANPIEPSHIGGEKLAKAIIQWMKNS